MASDQAVHHKAQFPAPVSPKTEYAPPAGMSRTQFRAMGTTISLLLPEHDKETGTDIVKKLFAEWEQTLSRFLPESELSQLNLQDGKSVAVSALLYNVLTAALDAAEATQGIYDPTLLKQLVLLGYDRSFEEMAAKFDLPTSLPLKKSAASWRHIYMDPAQRTVQIPAGVGLDFGGIAKGMAVDVALQRLQQAGIETALVNAGGDLAVMGLPYGLESWPLAVPGKDCAWTTFLHHGAMATSGIAYRHWQQGPYQRNHLLDPRTGQSTQSDLWSVTVVAGHCERAEVAAKVALILGQKQGKHFLRSQQLAGLLVNKDGHAEMVGSWPLHPMEDL